MTKFKKHEGKLFRMLEEPVPLTPDAEMPCLVRLIQDDSRMGMFNRDTKPSRLSDFYLVARIVSNNIVVDEFMESDYNRFEIIGTHVKEGSDKWALYHAINGEIVTMDDCGIYKIQNGKLWECFPNDSNEWRVVADDGYGYWLEYIHDNTGWQIYKEPEQPKTMPVNEFADLFDAPIGWICKTRDGGSFPLKYIEVSPTRYAYEDKSGLTVYVMANGRYKKNGTDGRDIISCEYEQPKPKYRVGDWIQYAYPNNPEFDIEKDVLCNAARIVSVNGYYENNVNIWIPSSKTYSYVSKKFITKVLSPSEVIVTIGCLSGTVKDLSYVEDGRFWFIGEKTERCPGGMHAILYDEMLDTETHELVKSLLKAQEEYKQ